jgi:hypothetical protein
VDEIVTDLETVARASFGVDLSRRRNGSVRHVLQAGHLALLHSRGTLLGFASGDFLFDEGVLYLHGAVISPLFKGKGASLLLTRALMDQAKLPLIAGTTQNPIIFCFFQSLCSEVWPSFPDGVISREAQKFGERFRVMHPSWHFDPATFIVRNLFKEPLYPAIPASSNNEVNAWFARALNVRNGMSHDAFLFVGNLKQ